MKTYEDDVAAAFPEDTLDTLADICPKGGSLSGAYAIMAQQVRELRDGAQRAEAGVKELEKWRGAVLSIVDDLDDPHVGLTWFDNTREVCAAELEHLRSVLVSLVRGEEE